jgi:hypothetical protein
LWQNFAFSLASRDRQGDIEKGGRERRGEEGGMRKALGMKLHH